MTPLLRNRLIGCVIALVIFAADQWSKNYVTKTLGIDRVGDARELLPIFDLRFTRNGVSLHANNQPGNALGPGAGDRRHRWW